MYFETPSYNYLQTIKQVAILKDYVDAMRLMPKYSCQLKYKKIQCIFLKATLTSVRVKIILFIYTLKMDMYRILCYTESISLTLMFHFLKPKDK